MNYNKLSSRSYLTVTYMPQVFVNVSNRLPGGFIDDVLHQLHELGPGTICEYHRFLMISLSNFSSISQILKLFYLFDIGISNF